MISVCAGQECGAAWGSRAPVAQGLLQAPPRCWAKAAVTLMFAWGINVPSCGCWPETSILADCGLHGGAHSMAAGFLQSKREGTKENGSNCLVVS